MYKDITINQYNCLQDKTGWYRITYFAGDIEYRVNGLLHREDGTAIIYVNSKLVVYYLHGKFIATNASHTDESWTRYCKLKAFI